MKWLKFYFLATTFLAFSYCAVGQRFLGINDSTSYKLNNGDTVIAGKYTLYKKIDQDIIPLKEFNDTLGSLVVGLERGWIRDFDAWDSQKWHVILGKSTYGGQTMLYKTIDAGQTWIIDTSYYSASNDKSLNQMQIINNRNALLFDGYYHSNVLKTDNEGLTWLTWLTSVFANHYGVFICTPKEYYLWGKYGDGFASYMFKIPDTAFASMPNEVRCNMNPFCIEAPTNVLYDIEGYFRPIFDSICNLTSTEVSQYDEPIKQFSIYPNPSSGIFKIVNPSNSFVWRIYNPYGNITKMGSDDIIDISKETNGLYILEIDSKTHRYYHKLIKY